MLVAQEIAEKARIKGMQGATRLSTWNHQVVKCDYDDVYNWLRDEVGIFVELFRVNGTYFSTAKLMEDDSTICSHSDIDFYQMQNKLLNNLIDTLDDNKKAVSAIKKWRSKFRSS